MSDSEQLSRVLFATARGLPFHDGFGATQLVEGAVGSRPVIWKVRQVPSRLGPWSATVLATAAIAQQPDAPELWLEQAVENLRAQEPREFISVVDAVTIFPSEAVTAEPRYRSANEDALMACFHVVQTAVRAYSIATANAAHVFTYQDIMAPVFAAQGSLDAGGFLRIAQEPDPELQSITWDEWTPLLLDHANHVPDGPPQFPSSESELAKFQHAWQRLAANDPFTRFQEAFAKADFALKWGRTTDAIVAYQTAGEVFYVHLLASLLWERGQAPDALEGLAKGEGQRLARKHLPQLLGGHWFNGSVDCQSREWSEQCSAVRNRIVHAGYTPALAEDDQAREATVELQRRLCDRLAQRSARYPYTALTVLGMEGLQRRKIAINAAVRNLVDTDDEWDAMRNGFAAWLEQATGR